MSGRSPAVILTELGLTADEMLSIAKEASFIRRVAITPAAAKPRVSCLICGGRINRVTCRPFRQKPL
jgi:hypothetical protein